MKNLAEYSSNGFYTLGITDDKESAPSNYAVNNFHKKVYGEAIEILKAKSIPYNGTGQYGSNDSWFTYENQESIKGQFIKNIKVNITRESRFRYGFTDNIRSYDVSTQFDKILPKGENIIEVNKILPADKFITFSGFYQFEGGANPVGGWFAGPTTPRLEYDICIGVEVETEKSIGGDITEIRKRLDKLEANSSI